MNIRVQGLGAVLALATLCVGAGDAAAKVRHRARHAHRQPAYEVDARDNAPAPGTPGGGPVSGPLAAGLLSLGISGASAADGYGYGGYQRRQPVPPGYGFYGNGYHGPSYSYTGY